MQPLGTHTHLFARARSFVRIQFEFIKYWIRFSTLFSTLAQKYRKLFYLPFFFIVMPYAPQAMFRLSGNLWCCLVSSGRLFGTDYSIKKRKNRSIKRLTANQNLWHVFGFFGGRFVLPSCRCHLTATDWLAIWQHSVDRVSLEKGNTHTHKRAQKRSINVWNGLLSYRFCCPLVKFRMCLPFYADDETIAMAYPGFCCWSGFWIHLLKWGRKRSEPWTVRLMNHSVDEEVI